MKNEDLLNPKKFFKAAEKGNLKKLVSFLEEGIDINIKDKDDDATALHKASGQGHEQLVQLLIKKGADVNVRDDCKCTPLHWASSGGYVYLGIKTCSRNA